MLAACTTGLRGEEVPLQLMDGLLTFWEESWSEQDWFIMLTHPEGGCFKGEIDKRWHLVPASNHTWSGLPINRKGFEKSACQFAE
jgi:hypothetical protein